MSKCSVLFVVLISCMFMSVFGAIGGTWMSELKEERVYGRRVGYCEYKGVKFLPRSKFIDYEDCAKCTCTGNGLECVGLVAKNRYSDDSPCVDVSIKCKTRWVLRNNKRRKCPKRLFKTMEISGVL